MKKAVIFLSLLLLLGACKKKEEIPSMQDFEGLMGKNLARWQYVQTELDFENLAFFKAAYLKNLPFLTNPSNEQRIPKKLHMIWLGPNPFPRESVDHLKTWISKHPDWEVYYWTDRERPLPFPTMKTRYVKDLSFNYLKSCFNKSENWGEKSDILRYEILYQEGGIYMDHDVRCVQAFDSMTRAYDLFCGLEMPYKTSLHSSIWPTNNLLGAIPGHPVFKHSMQWLAKEWDRIEALYPGKDRDSVIDRVSHRTFQVLGLMVKEHGNKENRRDMTFPAFYFNAPKEDLALWARHLYAGSWFEGESKFEKTTRQRLMYISKKANKAILFIGIATGINILCFAILFWRIGRVKKSI